MKYAVRAYWCAGEGVKGALGCAQGTRGSGRKGSALEWQGGGRVIAAKTRVGWPEEPHLRVVLMVGFRRSENTHGIAVRPSVLGVNRFMGPVDDYVTTNLPLTKSQSHKFVGRSWKNCVLQPTT